MKAGLLTGFTLALLVPAHGAEPVSRPNILYLFADDQSHRSVGSYGHRPWSWVCTPHIDQRSVDVAHRGTLADVGRRLTAELERTDAPLARHLAVSTTSILP